MYLHLEQAFLTVLNRGLTATWIVAAVLFLRAVLRGAPKRTRCLLWALVAVRLAFSLNVASPLSVFNLADTPVNGEGEVEYVRNAADRNGDTFVLLRESEPVKYDELALSGPRDPALSGESVTVAKTVPLRPLSVLWLAGMTAMLAYALASWLRLRKRVAASVERDGVRLCDDVDTPFILGIFAPRIYVPSGLAEPQLSHVLAHERAHLARRDHWWKPLGFALLAVYWFNPALWLAYVLLCRDIELACDERVLRELGAEAKKPYAEALLACSVPRHAVAACPVAFGETDVRERVRAALNYKKPAFWAVAAAVAVCAAAAVSLLTNPEKKQDLSFLNYENLVSLAAQSETLNAYRSDDGKLYDLDGREAAGYLDRAEWKPWRNILRSPARELENSGASFVQIEVGGAYVKVFDADMASVTIEAASGSPRYYRTGAGDYEALLALLTDASARALDEFRAAAEGAGEIHYLQPAISSEAFPDAIRDEDLLAEAKTLLLRVEEADSGPALPDDSAQLLSGSFYFDDALKQYFVCDGYLCEKDALSQRTLVLGKAPKGLMRLLEQAARRQADRGDMQELMFDDIMGYEGWCTVDDSGGYHHIPTYYTEIDGEVKKLAESFGFERDDHIVDLDGDGVTELVCNCVYGGDGARRVFIYRRRGGLIESGTIDYDKLQLTAWENWGVNSTAEWYDPASGKIWVEYASLASSSGDGTKPGTFLREAGLDAFTWQNYAALIT